MKQILQLRGLNNPAAGILATEHDVFQESVY